MADTVEEIELDSIDSGDCGSDHTTQHSSDAGDQVGSSSNTKIAGGKVSLCRTTPHTQTGKRTQMLKMLTLTLVPIIVLAALAIIDLRATVRRNIDAIETRRNVRFSRQVGSLVHSLQIERDMTALYISSLEQARPMPERKIALISTYPVTDEVLDSLNDWPSYGTRTYQRFENKEKFAKSLFEYRLTLDIHNTTIYEVIDFYTDETQILIDWLYEAVGKCEGQGLWETLVAYQFLIVGMEQIGIERTLGAVFYTHGGFTRDEDHLWYMQKFQVGERNIWMSQKYSRLISEILNKKVHELDHDFRGTIEELREPIRLNNKSRIPSWQDSSHWFDNMTLYIDTLRGCQKRMADIILINLETLVHRDEAELGASIGTMALVLITCIIIIKTIEKLANDIQNYAVLLAEQSRSVMKQRKHTKMLRYQLLPKSVVIQLNSNKTVNAEFYSEATLFFSDMVGFTQLCEESSPSQIVEIMNNVYLHFDSRIKKYDTHTVEVVGDCYIVVSGIPNRNGSRHASEIAIMELDLVNCIKYMVVPHKPSTKMAIRVANRIHLSEATFMILKKMSIFALAARGDTLIKGRGMMPTYWLLGQQLAVEEEPDEFDDEVVNLNPNDISKQRPSCSKPEACHDWADECMTVGELQSNKAKNSPPKEIE
uniref:Uncharacterized protein LOC100375697 n=1 Tax=Saccoglossus kowalevskii TaxID=10224 RepID=A0ABM0MVS0_SACKO|nr:PREDICTED: uncharacterized protein LOC100375697 [Saccoglossus kowalevskii]